MQSRTPVIFIGHGSPVNAMQENAFTKSLKHLGESLEYISDVLVISAHWLTKGTYLTAAARLETIYDFYGFPDELYQIQYAPPGNPALAKEIADLCVSAPAKLDAKRGIDHGAWAVLKHLFPKQHLPVLQLSIDMSLPPQQHLELARFLASLRSRGVLILGSGNVVHNLRMIAYNQFELELFDWAVTFDAFVKTAVEKNDSDALVNYSSAGRSASLAVPTLDHYLPILYTQAVREASDRLQWIHEDMQHGSISMRSWMLG